MVISYYVLTSCKMDILKNLITQHFSKLILQVWSRSSLYCIRTIGSGYGLSCLFVPGDRHVIVGTKQGSIQIFDLDKGTIHILHKHLYSTKLNWTS